MKLAHSLDKIYPSHLRPYPFQLEAVEYALTRNHSYLGYDPGLGKTIIAAMLINALKTPAVYVCPPFLRENIKNEFGRWLNPDRPRVLLIPDSKLFRKQTVDLVQKFAGENPEALLIVDEAHRFKSPTTQRSKAIYNYFTNYFTRRVFMSGTPMPNRPMELYPVLQNSAWNSIGFMSKFDFGRRYCAGHHNGFGWNFAGASRVPELAQRIIGPFMKRVRKSEVLTELPPKTEEILFIGDERDLPPEVAALDAQILKEYSPDDLVEGRLGKPHIATYRRLLGSLKVPESVTYIRFLIEECGEKILVFAWHKDVISELVRALSDLSPVIITGSVPSDERQARVDQFQNDDSLKLFIGNIQAAGVGFTMTAATRVLFVEFSWTPAENEQAEDRAHRIGQTRNVFIQYLVFKNSVDRKVAETILRKRKSIEQLH